MESGVYLILGDFLRSKNNVQKLIDDQELELGYHDKSFLYNNLATNYFMGSSKLDDEDILYNYK